MLYDLGTYIANGTDKHISFCMGKNGPGKNDYAWVEVPYANFDRIADFEDEVGVPLNTAIAHLKGGAKLEDIAEIMHDVHRYFLEDAPGIWGMPEMIHANGWNDTIEIFTAILRLIYDNIK